MITKEELKEYAKKTNLNLGQAELDYFQNILLFIIYREYGNELIFKGGTALKKCYGLDRFSEDLDFTCLKEINLTKIENGLKRFNIEFEIEQEEYERGKKIILKINGPLFIGIKNSKCRLVLDFSFREKILVTPIIKTIGRFLEEIPSFDVFVMHEKEILAEKVRAVLTRNLARDVYDINFLLEKNIEVEQKLINEKLSYYNKKFYKVEFLKKIKENEKIWKSELDPLIKNVPNFKKVKQLIERKMN